MCMYSIFCNFLSFKPITYRLIFQNDNEFSNLQNLCPDLYILKLQTFYLRCKFYNLIYNLLLARVKYNSKALNIDFSTKTKSKFRSQ